MAGGHGGGVLQTILKWTVVAIVALLLLLWLITGGPRKIAETASSIGNPIDYFFLNGTSTGFFKLPWQPELNLAPDLAPYLGNGSASNVRDLESEYDELQRQIVDAENFGDPSPHRGRVHITSNAARESIGSEYIGIEATGANTAPMMISGWSLQSAVTGIRAYIPRGSEVFILGAINSQADVALAPGDSAIIASSYSPVGTSFRENMCIGYLSGVQAFEPPLYGRCPEPADAMPLTADNIRAYGENCIDFIRTIPACTYPASVPPGLSSACRAFVGSQLSYNGCVQRYRIRSAFLGDTWRMYLGASGELWRNSHDVIRLLDAEGRTVDALIY